MRLGQGGIDHFDFVLDPFVNGVLCRKVDVVGKCNATFFGPLGNDIEADTNHSGQKWLLVTQNNHLSNKWGELELVLDKLRREAVTTPGDGDIADTINHYQMAIFLLEVTGVTGAHPALGIDTFTGRFSIFVVTTEHPRIAGDDFANPILVRIIDADITSLKGNPDAVVIDIIGGVNGVGTNEFGLTVNLAQRHPHRKKKLESIGAKRRTASCGRAQVAETKAIFKWFKYQPVSQLRWLAGLFKTFDCPPDAELVDPTFKWRGIHHSSLHVGSQRFPDPWCQQHEVGTNLT